MKLELSAQSVSPSKFTHYLLEFDGVTVDVSIFLKYYNEGGGAAIAPQLNFKISGNTGPNE